MKSLSRLIAVTRKEIRQMRRDRLTFAMIFGIPLMQIILFGYAINTVVKYVSLVVGFLIALNVLGINLKFLLVYD